ncbi:MAG: transposase [Methylocella sp.]
MSYTSGSHTVFHHRYHIVWITKYRYKVLEGALRERIRTIIRQVCKELGVRGAASVSISSSATNSRKACASS